MLRQEQTSRHPAKWGVGIVLPAPHVASGVVVPTRVRLVIRAILPERAEGHIVGDDSLGASSAFSTYWRSQVVGQRPVDVEILAKRDEGGLVVPDRPL